ncbi:phosphatidylserine decarboxylase [Anaeromyces robustus]|uniref:phosphatidylserine decarboxylase n=1 Tax=Anaeromyces robustus TaxID=1754192 RepID=A0A1Y1WYU5_9FUNG|nr:phosphatidylserine decarboxylase [Anaeromyces robustus]|eukprot:ORX78720.1 phosphatidylserine decarboxylase [Anaeromyces robustus]
MLPLRILSRFAGKVLNATVPEKFRESLYKAYAKKFNCNLDEMLDEDLTHYQSIAQFFYRKVKPEVRPIDKKAELVSPVDGRVLQFGEIINNEIEQVKGFTYSLNALLGYDGNSKKEKTIIFNKDKLIKSLNRLPSHVNMSHQKFLKTYSIDSSKDLEKMKENNNYDAFSRHGNKLFYCVLYLSPGDYHHFHSPTNWIIEKRRHFSGHLLSVSPKVVNLVHNLFTVNERIALIGRWKHGFFSMTPVGATNVGSVVLTIDDKLKTNMPYRKQVVKRRAVKYGVYSERSYDNVSVLLKGIPIHRGEELGGFQMGSTVVLVFEAPKSFKFNIKPYQKINIGQAISK